MPKPTLITLDFESILVPEAWVAIADASGIVELKRTTRDEPDFDKLMRHRIATLREHAITLENMDSMLHDLEPLEGAQNFLDSLRNRFPVLIISDTFMQFIRPVLPKLGYPTVLCHTFETDQKGFVTGYAILKEKGVIVKSLQQIGYTIRAVGDSFNDIGMLTEADKGYLFNASDIVREAHPDIPAFDTYEELQETLTKN